MLVIILIALQMRPAIRATKEIYVPRILLRRNQGLLHPYLKNQEVGKDCPLLTLHSLLTTPTRTADVGHTVPSYLSAAELAGKFVDQLETQRNWLQANDRFKWKPLAILLDTALLRGHASKHDDSTSIIGWISDLNQQLSSHLNAIVHHFSASSGARIPLNMRANVSTVCSHILHVQVCAQLIADRPHLLYIRTEQEDMDHVYALIQGVVDDMEALAKEKFGVCPPITIVKRRLGSSEIACLPQVSATPTFESRTDECGVIAVASLVQFVLVEVLKNAIGATVSRYGALQAEDAAPIEIAASLQPGTQTCQRNRLRITVTDSGVGIPPDVQPFVMATRELQAGGQQDQFSMLFTSHKLDNKDMNYHYSRQFGAPYAGKLCYMIEY
jgi:hypothetical protein